MLDALFFPETVAVIGASRTPGKPGHEIIKNLVQGGFPGTVIPVNPQADTVCGLPSLKKAGADGRSIDLGVIAVPRDQVFTAVKEAIAAGARALAVISAGFKESDSTGTELEEEIASYCLSRQVRLLGPNSLGVINTEHNLNAAFAGGIPSRGSISILSQSGAVCAAILNISEALHLGLAKVVSLGNKADISEADLLRILAQDRQTQVIVAYLEDIRDGDEFMKAAGEAASHKPVIVFKAGITEAGMRAASSHTGVLACTAMAYGSAFKRSGVIWAHTFDDLFDYATALAMQPIPRGNRILILTNAGGPGTMAADAAEKAGFSFARLNPATEKVIPSKSAMNVSLANPIYVLGDAPPDTYVEAMRAAQEDDNVDAVVVILTPQSMSDPAGTAQAIADHAHGAKPVLAAFMGGKNLLPSRERLIHSGLHYYSSPERAISALKAMYEYTAWLHRPPRVVTRFRVHRRRVERIITRHLRAGRLQINEVKSKSILQAYGFQIPEGYLATSVDAAIETAERIGYPVAMKIVSPDIVHKSDLGGVRLNVTNSEMVADAFDLMTLRIRQRAPEAWIEGIYVEKMLGRGLEVIIGMNRDPQFGPMLMFGLGGIFVEIMKDVTFYLAPITHDEAMQMLKSTRSYEMLQGKRGRRGVDLTAIANGLQRISQLTTDFPQIAELDINPFIVGEVGSDAFVTDARITLSETGGPC